MANRAAQLDAETRQAHPQATVKRRGRNFIEHDLGGGVTRWTGTIEPLHTRAGTAIDTAWVADASPWSYRVSAADYTLRIKAAFNGAPLLQYTDVASGAWVTLQPQQLNWTNDSNSVQMISAVQGVTAELADDMVRWPGAYGAGRDFVYINHPKRLIKHLVLQSALSTPSAAILSGANPCLQLQFILNWDGADVYIDGALWDGKTARTTANRIEFRVDDVPVYWLDAPTAWDATGENYATGVVLRTRKAGNNLYIEVRVPYAWLQGAQYPVMVDPTLTLQPDSAGSDTYIRTGSVTYNYGASTELHIHSTYTSLIAFDISSLPASATITSANVSLYCTGNFSLDNELVGSAYRALTQWYEGAKDGAEPDAEQDGSTWNLRNANGSVQWVDNTAGGKSGGDYASSATDTESLTTVSTWYSWNITDDVKAWHGETATNYGVWILGNNTYRKIMASSDHATSSYRPKLTIEYTSPGSPWHAYAQM